MNEECAIKVENVSMHFNMSAEKVDSLRDYIAKALSHQLFYKDFVAVDSVSFEVKKGEVFGIVGTNGSGKSTLLKMIAGVLEPTSGKISTQGKMAPLIELGAGFDGELTGRENIYLNGALLGYSKEFIDQQFKSIVDFAELWAFLDMPLKNYSSGMTARIAFAIATAVKPDILIADEILAVGDFLFQQKCEARIRELMEDGTTVLLVSHSIDQIESLCNRALWIEKGKQLMLGNTFDVCNAYRNIQNKGDNAQYKKYQIVAEEKCSICGSDAQFRDEPGMTYKTEAVCSCCGASIRTADMMKLYLKEVFVLENASLSYHKELFEKKKIYTSANWGPVTAFFTQFENYYQMDGDYSDKCKALESEELYEDMPDDLDLICLEDLFICTENTREIIRKLKEHLSSEGVLLLTLQVYDGEKTELDKKTKHDTNWNGLPMRNKWGSADMAEVFNELGFDTTIYNGHKWYEPDEILKYGTYYKEFENNHPFYFLKFNTWAIVAKNKGI